DRVCGEFARHVLYGGLFVGEFKLVLHKVALASTSCVIQPLGTGRPKSTVAVRGHLVQCKAAAHRLSRSKVRFATAATDKMGQIRRTPKWL
ncbi:MAG: hypothetical protein ACK5EJ_00035, partial [Sphingomonadaceae bacterium]